jgi:hypothetical protein
MTPDKPHLSYCDHTGSHSLNTHSYLDLHVLGFEIESNLELEVVHDRREDLHPVVF